ncbi:C39 family peptidase [Dactylosporangium salmoneum]|uniref:Peptidase C39-like domain-containing protein n=1 Tax=Dactylosporangium salmoneum TaxID=53361 RepID=A0ABN3FYG3_9ACTN
MNPEPVREQANHAGGTRRLRLAVISIALLGAAAAAGSACSRLGDPPASAAAAGAAAATPPPSAGPGMGDAAVQSTAPAPSTKVLAYQFQLQPNYYYCGPAATRIALTAAGHAISQDQAASMLGTTTNGTDSALDTTRVLNSVLAEGRTVYRTREIPAYPATAAQAAQLQADVVGTIGSGRAIVANIAGHLTDAAGVVHAYEGGHYLTLVGYQDDGKAVKIADPADRSGNGSYWVSTPKLADWISEHGYSY